MKLYAPRYYRQFHCLAAACEHSCCVGWEIDLDPDTLARYLAAEQGYAAVVRDSIVREETPHFRLDASDRCPHLDEHGLCRIILHLGEDQLCDICREHPRFYLFTSMAEVGLGLSCTEAARIVLASSDYVDTVCLGTVDASPDGVDFDARGLREELYRILQDRSRPYAERLASIYIAYGIGVGEDALWHEALGGLEYLDKAHRALFLRYTTAETSEGNDDYRERFLAYLIFRHGTEAVDREDFRIRLAFCLFGERLFASLLRSEKASSLQEAAVLARIFSEEIEYSEDNTDALLAMAETLS